MKHQELWEKISAFSLDKIESRLKFSQRLARENGWTIEYALRAIEEYKKFMFLAAVSGHSVTPSDEVDQVWHLHLLYTESYWKEFCRDILGKEIHHGPTKGGKQESQKFENWYQRTLDSYKSFFGYDAPSDIWPASEKRFAIRNFKRIDVSQYLMIDKEAPKKLLKKITSSFAAILTLLLLTSASGGFGFFIVVLIIGTFAFFISWILSKVWGNNPKDEKSNSEKKKGIPDYKHTPTAPDTKRKKNEDYQSPYTDFGSPLILPSCGTNSHDSGGSFGGGHSGGGGDSGSGCGSSGCGSSCGGSSCGSSCGGGGCGS